MLASAAILSMTAGWLALSRAQEGPGRVEPRLHPEVPSPASRNLLEEQALMAKEVSDLELVRFQEMHEIGNAEFETILTWSRRAMEARLRLASDNRQRLETIREHRRRAVRVERLAEGYAQSGQCRKSEVPRARYYRLEADRLLIEAGGDPSKEKEEAEAAPAPKGPSQPPPPPASR